MAKQVCLCTYCRNMLTTDDDIAELKYFDSNGHLNYILLAHNKCVIDHNDAGQGWVLSAVDGYALD